MLGADYGSDHKLIAKFRLTLKKVEKTTRPFRYDLNQTSYDYTVEKRNRFKGLDLIDRAPDELWTEVCDIVQETGIKAIPKKELLGLPYSCCSASNYQSSYISQQLPHPVTKPLSKYLLTVTPPFAPTNLMNTCLLLSCIFKSKGEMLKHSSSASISWAFSASSLINDPEKKEQM